MEYRIEKKSATKATLYITTKYPDEYEGIKSYNVIRIKRQGLGKGIEVRFADSSAPKFSLKNLMELSDFFGTTDIDFNNSIQVDGCPTCGAGSEYGYELQIYRIKKNYPFK